MRHIEADLRALSATRERLRSSDMAAVILEESETVMGLLREAIPGSAYGFSAFDPLSGSHVYRQLVNFGYPDAMMQHLNDAFIKENPLMPLLWQKGTVARWRDMRREWGFDFSDTLTAQEFCIPAGFHEGISALLRRPEGRHTGIVHISWSTEGAATTDRRDALGGFLPSLALICDLLRAPQIIADAVAPGKAAIVLSTDGATAGVPGHPNWFDFENEPRLRDLLTRIAATMQHRRFLWADRLGNCHRLEVLPCSERSVLVTEEPIPWPYGVTRRELQILHLVARGLSNPEIAQHLIVSPRTVSTHVEHLLSKLGCSARAGLAATAVSECLMLGADPSRHD